MTETPIDDAREQDGYEGGTVPLSDRAMVEADEADAAEQASDVPIDDDEYR